MRCLVALGLLLTVPVAAPSFGQSNQIARFYTGNDLKQLCDRSKASCTNYIIGASDMIQLSQSKKWICLPSSVDSIQLVDIIIKSLETNPETRHVSASVLIWNSLLKTFPCERAP